MTPLRPSILWNVGVMWLGLFGWVAGLQGASPVPTLPESLSSRLILWLRADTGVVCPAEGRVSRWEDQSGHRHDAIQNEPSFQPRLVPGTNGQPTELRFNGLTNFLEVTRSPQLTLAGDLSVFAVLQVDDFSTLNGILGATHSNIPAPLDVYVLKDEGTTGFFRGDGTNYGYLIGQRTVPKKEWFLLTSVTGGGMASNYLNGAYNGSTEITVPVGDLGGPVRVGSRDDREARLKGALAEILVFNHAVSEAERAEVHRYLNARHGLNTLLGLRVTAPPEAQHFEGQTVALTVNYEAVSPDVRFQWQKDGQVIPGATNAVYHTPPLTLGDNRSIYRVRLSLPGTNVTRDIRLTVIPDTEPLNVSTAAFLLRDQSPVTNRAGSSLPATNESHSILPPYAARRWLTAEDSARNVIQAVAQTADGFLWVGTHGGLARFDGDQFEFLPVGPEKKQPWVNALYADTNGVLWAGTTQGLFQRENGAWKKIALPEGLGESIFSLQADGDGRLWIGSRAGLAFLEAGRVTAFPDPFGEAIPPSRNLAFQPVRAIARDPAGRVWISCMDNLLLVQHDQMITNVSLDPFRADFLRSVCHGRDGRVWVAGNSGLISFRDGVFTRYTKANGLPDNTVTAVYEDRRGNLWVGTYGGLCRFVDGKFVTEVTPDGEPYDQIICFFEDREDNLWVGTKDGLYQLNIRQFITYTTLHGLAHNNVISVYEDRDGAIWVGTWGGGLHCLRSGKITIYSAERNPALRNNLVLAIHGGRDGSLWFTEDYGGGIYRMQNGRFQNFSDRFGLARNAVRALAEDTEGRVWMGLSSVYLKVHDHGRTISYGPGEGLLTNATRCLLPAQDGRMWVGTEAGLSLFKNGGFQTFTRAHGLPSDVVLALYEDKERNIWMGTGQGLVRLSFAEAGGEPRFTSFSFYQEAVLEVVEDDFDHLWLGTHDGVIRVAKKELASASDRPVNFTLFGKADGMGSQVCVGVAKPSAVKSRDGRLWFATTKGLAVTDPKLQIARNDKPPFVVIREVLSEKSSVLRYDAWRAAGKNRTAVLLASGRGELEFHYTALSFMMPEKNRYKYRLEGFDRDWIEAGTRRTAFYNGVPPGNYTFQVMACNNDGVWNPAAASVRLSLSPNLWQTWWARLLLAGASLGLAAAAARLATKKRMQRKLERLEQQHAVERERARIAQDMHDDLGACVTEILLLSNLARDSQGDVRKIDTHLARIADSAREVVRNLDGIVWAVNPENDSLAGLAGYIHEYAEQFLSATSIRCRFEVSPELPAFVLSSEARHHLFLVVKEAMNNIVKHAQATELWIRLTVAGGTLCVTVEDNGRGFDPSASGGFGNGLRNMRKRMEKIGARLEVTSAPGKGTQIKIQIPLKDVKNEAAR